MKKFSITLLTLSLASTLIGQNTNDKREDVKIEEQSENQYKESNNFYINSQGLVVYKRGGSSVQENDTVNNTGSDRIDTEQVSTNEDKSLSHKGTPVIVKKEAYNSEINPSEEKDVAEAEPVLIKPIKKTPVSEYSATEKSVVDVPPPPVKSGSGMGIKKAALTVDQSISINSRSENINNSEDEDVNYEAINPTKKEKKSSTQAGISKEEAKKKYKKYNSYEKRPSQYKSIEEAALAVDAMIEELKKNQGGSTGAKSMSSRLSTGANRASLRKKPLNNTSYASESETRTKKPTPSVADEFDSSWGDQPTYYINGTEVELSDIEELRKKDIIRKEFKIRNTASGNPNGEVWYEVQDYKKQ